MFLKVVFDQIVFVKFKISNYFKQNIDKPHSKQPKIHRITICEKKFGDFWQIFAIPKRKTYPRLWIKNL